MEYNETLSHKKGFGLSLLKVKVYGTRLKWSIVVGCLVATVRASPRGGGGVVLPGIFSGGVLPVSPKPDLFRPDL